MIMSKAAEQLLQEETKVLPYRGGIKLDPSTNFASEKPLQLVQFLALKMSVYFLDCTSTTYLMNEYGATLCGFDSADDSKGRTLMDVAEPKSAQQLMQNSQKICQLKRVQVFEECLLKSKGEEQTIFSIKFPWFNQENQLVGSAGFSFKLQPGSFLDSLRQLRALGLFNPITALVSKKYDELQHQALTPRENDCAYWLIRGNSAKQIALKLGLSYRTIEDYLATMKLKLKVGSKQALIEKLIEEYL